MAGINFHEMIERIKDEVPFDKVLMAAMKAPGAQVNREVFYEKS